MFWSRWIFFVASAFRPVWSGRCDLSFICIPQSTRALDQGGVEPRQAVSPKALRPWTIPLRYSVGWVFWSRWSVYAVYPGLRTVLSLDVCTDDQRYRPTTSIGRTAQIHNFHMLHVRHLFFFCVCLMASMTRSVNCLGQKNAVQVHLIGAKPIVQVKRWNERQNHSSGSLYEPNKNNNTTKGRSPPRQPGIPLPGFQVHGPKKPTTTNKRLQRQILVRLNVQRSALNDALIH